MYAPRKIERTKNFAELKVEAVHAFAFFQELFQVKNVTTKSTKMVHFKFA